MNKIDILKSCINLLAGNKQDALRQAIKALDNPLGVLPGDEIEVWNGVNWKLLTFDSYDSSNTDSWWCEGHWYTDARTPQINIPVLTEYDVEFLNDMLAGKRPHKSLPEELRKILERKN